MRTSLASLHKDYSNGTNAHSNVVIIWPLLRVRRSREPSAEESPVQIHTEKKQILADYDSDEALQEQESTYNGDRECDSNTESSDGEQDVITTLPRNRRLRLLQYQRERESKE